MVSAKFNLKTQSSILAFLAKAIDVMLYFAAALFAYYMQFDNFYFSSLYKIAIFAGVFLVIPIFSALGVYQSLRGRSFFTYIRSLYVALITLMIVLAAIGFITKTGEYFSRAWFLMWNLYAAILLTFFRVILRQTLRAMRKHGLNQRWIAIVGSHEYVQEIIKHIHDSLWSGYHVAALFDYDKHPGKVNNFAEEIKKLQIDEVWIAGGTVLAHEQTDEIIRILRNNVITIRFLPSIFGVELINQSVSEILGMPVINIIASPITGVNKIIKMFEDYVLSAVILLLISPLLLLIALAVKLSTPGPVFYKQLRHGWDGKPISVLKFRTMFVHKEKHHGTVTQAKSNDARITKIGRFLRRTSLDELPQFFNVLKGDMSIVGPRPHAIEHNEMYKKLIPSYMMRHHVKPGITGWAQITGWRGETDTLEKMQKRVEFDLYYINHWSLWFDLKIIFLTIFKGFVHKNAY